MTRTEVDVTADGSPADGREYLGFLARALAVIAGLLVLGYVPTVRLAGDGAVPAMLAGCGLSLVASLAGTVPIVLARQRTALEAMPSVIGSITLRIALVLALATAAALSGWFVNKPLLLWVAISHVGLLVVDTHFARTQLGA